MTMTGSIKLALAISGLAIATSGCSALGGKNSPDEFAHRDQGDRTGRAAGLCIECRRVRVNRARRN